MTDKELFALNDECDALEAIGATATLLLKRIDDYYAKNKVTGESICPEIDDKYSAVEDIKAGAAVAAEAIGNKIARAENEVVRRDILEAV